MNMPYTLSPQYFTGGRIYLSAEEIPLGINVAKVSL